MEDVCVTNDTVAERFSASTVVDQGNTRSSQLRGRWTWVMMILLLLGCLVIGGTDGARFKRVIGGNNVDIKKAPYQVSIRVNDIHICGGSLISGKHVLTAAHCVYELFEEPYEELIVVTGSDSLKSGGTAHNVRKIKWHDDFVLDGKSLWHDDIAIITLAKNVAQNEKQRPILLPIKDVTMNVTGFVTGFGRTVTGNPYLSATLKSMNIRILPSKECKRFTIGNKICDNQICGMQPKGIGVCKGDSGGALVYDKRIVGIISSNWQDPCGSGLPDIYTNVFRYLDFIQEVITSD